MIMPRTLSDEEVRAFRHRIRQVAERQFAELGYAQVSLRTITDELGCSRMTPYRYFKDKDEIFADVRTAAYDRFATAQERAASDQEHPLDRLDALRQAYLAFAIEQPHAYRLMFGLSQPDPNLHPALRDAEARAWAPIQQSVQAAVDASLLDGDPSLIAHAFWISVHGLVSLHLAGKLVYGASIEDLSEPLRLQMRRGARPQDGAGSKDQPRKDR